MEGLLINNEKPFFTNLPTATAFKIFKPLIATLAPKRILSNGLHITLKMFSPFTNRNERGSTFGNVNLGTPAQSLYRPFIGVMMNTPISPTIAHNI